MDYTIHLIKLKEFPINRNCVVTFPSRTGKAWSFKLTCPLFDQRMREKEREREGKRKRERERDIHTETDGQSADRQTVRARNTVLVIPV